MSTALWLGLALVSAALAAHPCLTYPWSLRVLRRLRQNAPAPCSAPPLSLSVCVCAYNEAERLPRQLERLLALRRRHPGLEILVYIDAATDGTAELVAAYEDDIQVEHSSVRRGKTYGMNQLVARARGAIIVFTDAAVLIDEAALDGLAAWFADPRVGCVTGTVRVHNAADSAVAAVGAKYWAFDDQVRDLESALGCVIGAHGPLFAMRRSLHRPPPEHLIDDLYLSLDMLCRGYRVIQARDFGVSRASASAAGDEYARKVRIACQAWNVHRALWPRLRRLPWLTLYCYLSHKPWRWLSGLGLISTLAFLMAALIAAGHPVWATAIVVGGLSLWWLGHRHGRAPWAKPAALVSALFANLNGLIHSLQGRRYQTWALAASARAAAPRPLAQDGQTRDTL